MRPPRVNGGMLGQRSAVSENTSVRSQGCLGEKLNSATGECMQHKRRQRLRNQLQIMAEVIRRNIRSTLMKATSISLAIDESQHQKIVRFRADLPQPLARDCFYGHLSAGTIVFRVYWAS